MISLGWIYIHAQNNISEVEYFIDNDPGFGNAIAITVTPAYTQNISLTVPLSGLSNGLHVASFRALNDSGWSITFNQPFIFDNNSGQNTVINITDVEYFIDTDPGFGNGSALIVSPNTLVNLTDNVSLSGLTDGLHILHLRAKDQNGTWGWTYAQPFVMLGAGISPNIIEIEYFIDTDPGFGNGSGIAVASPSNSITESFNVDLNVVSAGMHVLHVRAKDTNEKWSLVYSTPFISLGSNTNPDIDYVEYFFDNDPGYGNGTNLPITAGQVVLSEPNFDISALSTGIHFLHIRAKNSNGFWSMNYAKPFVNLGQYEPIINYVEFHIDSFTGFGNGIPVAINQSTTIDTSLIVPLPQDITAENHDIFVVAKDNNGSWSLIMQTVFCVGAQASFVSDTTCLNNETVFTSTSVNTNSSTTYSWDINMDGVIDYSTQNIMHQFGSVGTFPVTLILDKDSLCPDTFKTNVLVDSIGSITGNIFNGAGAVTSGYVKLFEYKNTGVMPLVDSVVIDVNGDYQFSNIMPDNYLIKAYPNKLQYPNTVSTYLDSTISWSKADIVYSLCDTIINIGLLDISLVQGDGYINGYIFSTDTTNRAGDPLPGVDIALEQIPGGIIADVTTTDGNGFYEFKQLPNYTYEIRVDIPGASMDSTYRITINANDTVFENLNFTFDSAKIYIEKTTGIVETKSDDKHRLSVYPNPFKNDIYINLVLNENTSFVQLKVYDLVGKEITSLINNQLNEGTYNFTFNPNKFNLQSGIYFVKLQIDNNSSEVIRIIQTH